MKKVLYILPLLLITWGVFFNCKKEKAWEYQAVSTLCKSEISDMRVDLLSDPLGVNLNPSFSWINPNISRGKEQKKYRITVGANIPTMEEGLFVRDSGWVESSKSSGVKFSDDAALLNNNQLYYWKVELEDEEGNIIKSSYQPFVTEMGDKWESKGFIWGRTNTTRNFMRTQFKISNSDEIDKVILCIAATAPEITRQHIYDIYVNGSFIGLGPMRENHGTIYYNSYDITEFIQHKNVLGMINYAEGKNKGILCQLTAFYKDGTSKTITNSASDVKQWKVMDADAVFGSSNETIGTINNYIAKTENIDACLWPDDWQKYTYFLSPEWYRPFVQDPVDAVKEVKPYKSENAKRFQVPPAKIEKRGKGHYFIDLGKEIIGGVSLYADSPVKQQIVILCGEELEKDGSVKYRMRTGNIYEQKWTLKKGKQKIENTGVMGFRYIEILNMPVEVKEGMIFGVSIRQDFEDGKSYFHSSDQLLNKIYDTMKYSIMATNQLIMVDSQTRERSPYEGDAYINSLSSYVFSDNYSLSRISNEWLITNRTWPLEYVLFSANMMWNDYLYTGDPSSMQAYYDILTSRDYGRTFFDDQFDERVNLLYYSPNNDNETNSLLVDWPPVERDNYADGVYYSTVENAIAYRAYQDLSKIASSLDKERDAQYWNDLAEQIKIGLYNQLYNESLGAFSDGLARDRSRIEHYSQHATAYVLASGVFQDDTGINEKLSRYIEKAGGFKTSIYGSFFVLKGLYHARRGDVALKFLKSEGLRSYDHVINELGATITPEAWDPSIKENMTFSHAWGTAPASQIATGMFGIEPLEPGFELFEIDIQPGALKYGEIKIPTVKGEIKVLFDYRDNCVYEVQVPFNSKCRFVVLKESTVICNGEAAVICHTDNKSYISLNSGRYRIEVE